MAERIAAISAAQENPERSWRVEDPNNGPLLVLLHGRMLYAIVNAPPGEEEELARAVELLAD
jgi:hypothetical protein